MTATDVDLDALLDRLLARAAQREAPPLVNAAGTEVNPLTPAGRVTVHPNDLIASAWGNLVFDQSTNQFASVADRDSQWPAPPDGALCYTTTEQTLWLRRSGVWVAAYAGTQPPYTGAGIGTYTDPSGDVWVAKASVNGGAWKRARDVLYAAYTRSSAFTVTTTPTLLVYNAVLGDNYGIYNPANGLFTAPVPGYWRFDAALGATATATGQSAQINIVVNGTITHQAQLHTSFATWFVPGAFASRWLNAGDQMSASVAASVSMTGAANPITHMSVGYLGTG